MNKKENRIRILSLITILLIITISILGCSSKKNESQIKKIINDGNYYNNELWVSEEDNDLYSFEYEGYSKHVIIPDKWNNEAVTRVNLSTSNDNLDIEYFYIPQSVTYITGWLNIYFSDVKKIYYGGSKNDWDKIVFDARNEKDNINSLIKSIDIIYDSNYNVNAEDKK